MTKRHNCHYTFPLGQDEYLRHYPLSRYYSSTCTNGKISEGPTTSSTIDDKTEPIQVTVSSSKNSTKQSSDTSSSSVDDANKDDPTDSSENPFRNTKQKQQEEELSILQSHVRTHYQHANYTEALKVSQEILAKTLELFNKSSHVDIDDMDDDDMNDDDSEDQQNDNDDVRAHPAIASAHNNIGLMHKMMGKHNDSRNHYRKALQIYAIVVGKDHASYATTLNNLGNLDRTQSQLDSEISDREQIRMVARAASYFEQAYEINRAELGEDNVHTLTSLSNLGGSIAAQVLKTEWLQFNGEKKNEEQQQSRDDTTVDSNTPISTLTQQKWNMAEQYLRSAFRTSVNNPRGEKVAPTSRRQADDQKGLPPRRDKSLSKKQKKNSAKKRRKLLKEMKQDVVDSNGQTVDDKVNSSFVSSLGHGDTQIRTLSASNAAQNLAVFLKSRADLLAQQQVSNSASSTSISLDNGDMYAEAKNLYLGALHVRTLLRGEHHPDTVTTKFSLAELIEKIGDKGGAQTLREEIINSYDIEEREEDTDKTIQK